MEIRIDTGAAAKAMLRPMLGVRSESGRLRTGTVRIARTVQSPRALTSASEASRCKIKPISYPYE
jgi:hypothetical protein